jgi:hypothetical protein
MGSKFTKSTDEQHKIKLDSSIIYAGWNANEAHIGCEVGFEVRTMFVGEGGKISIVGKTENGKKLGKVKGKIYGNCFVGTMPIPEKFKPGDLAYFEVKLSQLGLDDESNRIPIKPKIEVTNMKWDKKEARRGDILKLTADVKGVGDGSKIKVIIYEYDQDDNNDKIAELPAIVKNDKIELSWEYEYHEDTDEIATDNELKKYGKNYNPPEYFFVIDVEGAKFGQKQESGLLLFKDWMEISLTNENGEPAADEKNELIMPDGSKREGKLDSSGHAREKDIPPGPIEVKFPDFGYFSSQAKGN